MEEKQRVVSHNENQPLIAVKEFIAATMLDVSVSTIRRWRLTGKGPVFRKLGGSVRYLTSDIEQFILDRACTSTQGVIKNG